MLNPQSPLNHLLAALSSEEYKRISADLTVGELKIRQHLQRPGEPLREVYFPSRSLCSLTMTMEDGASAEIATVGLEGLVGVEAVLGFAHATCDATVQVAGDGIGHAMTVEAFRRELDQRGALDAVVRKYTQGFVAFVTQSAACSGLHSADGRCCRWLLHAQDRLSSHELPVTHELIATMLGVRRPTVTLIITDLVRLGIISTSRGLIRIIERTALEGRCCECYKRLAGLFESLRPFDASKRLQHVKGDESWQERVVLTT
jgi:CRP-like cAMP-binding protein